MEGYIQVKLARLSYLRQETRGALLTLQEVSGERQFSLMIGIEEATSIACFVHKLSLPVALTHDLMHNILTQFDFTLSNIIIHNLKNGIFHTSIDITQGNVTRRMCARISDAVAMALRFEKPIYMNQTTFEQVVSKHSSQLNEQPISPETDLSTYNINQLNNLLSSCVEQEKYEQAILLRNEITRRQESISEN